MFINEEMKIENTQPECNRVNGQVFKGRYQFAVLVAVFFHIKFCVFVFGMANKLNYLN